MELEDSLACSQQPAWLDITFNKLNIVHVLMPHNISIKSFQLCICPPKSSVCILHTKKQILHFSIVKKETNHPISTRDYGDYCTEEETLLTDFVCFYSVVSFWLSPVKRDWWVWPTSALLTSSLIPFHFPTRSRFISVQSKLLLRTTSAETINSENIPTRTINLLLRAVTLLLLDVLRAINIPFDVQS